MDTFNRYIVYPNGEIYDKQKETKIKQFKSNKYKQCVLFDDNGKKHVFGVHTVVARFLCDDWFEGCVVHHIDGNTHNNCVDNLECLSRSEHSRHHADITPMLNYINQHGAWNKGKSPSEETRKKISEAKRKQTQTFFGNQYVDANGNRKK